MGVLDRGAMKLWMAMAISGVAGAVAGGFAARLGAGSLLSWLCALASAAIVFVFLAVIDERRSRRP
jgi:uncharacterized membrane protein YfcA